MSARGKSSKGIASKKNFSLSTTSQKKQTDDLSINNDDNVYSFHFTSMKQEHADETKIKDTINTSLKKINTDLTLHKLLDTDTIIVIGENYLYKYIKEIKDYTIISLNFYSSVKRQVHQYNSITYLYGYEYMECIMNLFVYERIPKVKGLFLLSYNHKFYLNADLYYKQLYDLFKLHKEKKLYVYPNPLLIFLVECKLYYYFLLKMNTGYKDIILDTQTLIHSQSMFDREKFFAPRKYNFGMFGLDNINYNSVEFKQLTTNVFGYLIYAIQNGYDITRKNSDYIKMGLSGSNDCATTLESINDKSHSLALQCTNSGIILYQKRLKNIKDELRLLFYYSGGDKIIYFPTHYDEQKRTYGKINNKSYTDIIPEIKTKILDLIKELSVNFGNIFFGRVDFIIHDDNKFKFNEIELYPGPNYMSMFSSRLYNNNISAVNTSLKESFITSIRNAISNTSNIPVYPGDIVEKGDLTYLETMLIQLSTLLPDEHKLSQEKLKALEKTVGLDPKSLKNISNELANKTITVYDLGDNKSLIGGNKNNKKNLYYKSKSKSKKLNHKYKNRLTNKKKMNSKKTYKTIKKKSK